MKEVKSIKAQIEDKEKSIKNIKAKIDNTKSKLLQSKYKGVDMLNHGFLLGLLK